VADYITITEAQSDPEAAVDSSLIKRLRDNPIAIAEGAAGAPRIVPSAVTDFFIGNISGAATFVGFSNIENDKLVRVDVAAAHSGTGGSTLRLRLSSDNGSTWSAEQTISVVITADTTTTQANLDAYLFVNMATGAFECSSVGTIRVSVFAVSDKITGTVTGSNFNAMQIRMSSASSAFAASFVYLGLPNGI